MKKLQNYINGKFQAPALGKYIENFDPSKGVVFSLIPDSDAQDVSLATEAAKAAFPKWSAMTLNERSEILLRLSKGIEDRMDEFVAAESLDNGKPVSLASHVDIPRAVSNLKFFATAIQHFAAESHVDNSISHPDAFIKTNIFGTFNLLDVAKKHWMKGPNEIKSGYEN